MLRVERENLEEISRDRESLVNKNNKRKQLKINPLQPRKLQSKTSQPLKKLQNVREEEEDLVKDRINDCYFKISRMAAINFYLIINYFHI